MESGFVMCVCIIILCPEAYTSSTQSKKVPDFVVCIYIYITKYSFVLMFIQSHRICRWMMINMYSVEYYFQWQLSQYSDGLKAGLRVVCFLAEARDLLSIQKIQPFLGPIWPPVQWIFWILPHCSSSWCMSLITQLSFLLRLQIVQL